MEVRVVDPLAGKEAVVSIHADTELGHLKRTACRILGISLPDDSNQAEYLERVTLTLQGKRLEKARVADDLSTSTGETATLVCFVRPRLVKSTDDDEEDDDDVQRVEREVEQLFRLNQSLVPPRIRHFLLNTCKVPEWVIAPATHVRAKHVGVFFLWIAGCKAASRYELGPPYLLGTLFYVMLTNLSTAERREGEWSAYSIFNRGVRRLGGDNLDGNARTGGWFRF